MFEREAGSLAGRARQLHLHPPQGPLPDRACARLRAPHHKAPALGPPVQRSHLPRESQAHARAERRKLGSQSHSSWALSRADPPAAGIQRISTTFSPRPQPRCTAQLLLATREAHGGHARHRAHEAMSPDSPSAAARRVSRPRPTRPTAEQQRRRDAALAQERAEWDRTRGAGAGVLRLLEEPSWRRAHAGKPPEQWSAPDVLPSITRIEAAPASEIREVPSADRLLATGIGDYTLLPKILGRGKFSTVFLASKQGKLYALKHTPLFPHHMLIATRLLREPTLLAELPPHPNLVAVHETIRTPGHFYLIEEYLGGYVTLERLLLLKSTVPPPSLPVLPTDVAGTVFSQLISAVEAIQHPLQICHRDIKPENILVHPVSLQLKLLDFGLATHYSKSQAKLSTCCGSPAYHCPEIVHALSSPLGTATYWGPEVDAWTVGVTMLRVLTGVRYPLGSSHNSLRSMAVRAQRAVALVQDPDLRRRTGMLLDMDAIQRMRNFELLARDAATDPDRTPKEFKSSTFVPTPPTHLIKLPLLVDKQGEPLVSRAHSRPREVASLSPSPAQAPPTPAPANPVSGGQALLTLLNPSHEPGDKVLSFIKYALRCFGILYHAWVVEEEWVLECVWEVPPVPETGGGTSFVHSIMSALGRKEKRSSSALVAGGEAPRPSPGPSGREGKIPCLRFYLIVRSLRSRRSPSMYRHASLGRTASRPGDNEVSEPGRTQSRPPARKRIHVLLTDGRALAAVAHALSLGGTQTVEEEEEERGRRPHPRRSSLAPTTSTVSEERGRRHFSRHASLAPSEATSRARAGRGRTRDQMDDWEREIGNAVQDLNLCLRGKDGGGGLSHLAASLMRWETQGELHPIMDRTFAVFAALTPSLGVHSLALSGLQVLSVFSRHAPPREVFVALLERFDTLGTDCVQPHWNPLKEVIALLDLLIIGTCCSTFRN